MTNYSVYQPSAEAPDLEQRADALHFVKEGFCWPALLVPAFWLLYHRMWIELALLVAAFAGLQWAAASIEGSQDFLSWVGFGLLVLFAFEANDLRRYALERRGYRLAGIANGRDREEAELGFFRAWLPQQAKAPRHADRPVRSQPTAAMGAAEPEDVIGSFPRA